MKRMRRFLRRVGNLIFVRRDEQRLREEIEEHIAHQTADNLRAGMAPAEARRQALVKFGAAEAIKESVRAERGMPQIESVVQDLRFAVRMLAKSPGFAAVAILTIALGIGANTAIFSVMDAVMFRPLSVRDPQQLVLLRWTARNNPKHYGRSSYGDCTGTDTDDCVFSVPFSREVRAEANVFSGLAVFAGPLDVNFRANGPANIARGGYVSGDFFSTLGLKTILGRPLGPADDQPSAPPAIVLNYAYWQSAFGGDPSVVGRTVRLNNVETLIAGIAEPGFSHITPGKTQDFFMTFSLVDRVRSEWWGDGERINNPSVFWAVIVGRLRPGVSIAQAQAALSPLFRSQVEQASLLTGADAPAIVLKPAREGLDGESFEFAPMLDLLMSAVGFVLLIACANVAGLILARSAKRQKELATRQALGAGRGRIARQLLTESVVVSVAGGALGVVVAIWGVKALVVLLQNDTDSFSYAIAPDWRVLGFTAAVTLATGILSGLAPTFRSARVDLTPSLRENASSAPGGARHSRWRFRLGDALVVAQVALSIVMLIGAGLLLRTLSNLRHLNPGFDTDNVLLFGMNPNIAGYKDFQAVRLYRDLQQRFAALPGVLSVSYSEEALLSQNESDTEVHLDSAPPKSNVRTEYLPVGSDFFSTLRIGLLAGHGFTSADFAQADATHAAVSAAEQAAKAQAAAGNASRAPSPGADRSLQPMPAPMPVIINRTFATRYFHGRNPLGLHMGSPQSDRPATGPQPGFVIVGIAEDAKYESLRGEIRPTMYRPLTGNSAHFELRTSGDPMSLVAAVRKIVAEADNNLPLTEIRTQSEQIDQILFQERLMSSLSSFFALLALVLACIGLYGLLSYEVARRTRELGIRMALGADKRDLMRLVLRQGLILALAGSVIGIGAAVGLTRLMTSLLYDVRPGDPMTFASVCFLLLMVAAAACLIPARRATRVEPMEALRTE
ncbi:MAG TPA: ABC transporter permease [Terracidiphilus sp.]|nr:ABC transporter permease [Terracidiphilus sp.]